MKAVYFGYGETPNSFMPKVNYWSEDVELIPYDVEKAKELVAASDYDGTPIQLMVDTGNAPSRQIATILEQGWAEAGLKVAILEAAFDLDMSPYIAEYRHKRDRVVAELDPAYQLVAPGGSFYAFPQLPTRADGSVCDSGAFLEAALQHKLLIVPGKAFSRRDTHFRISFAAEDDQLARGIGILNDLARQFA